MPTCQPAMPAVLVEDKLLPVMKTIGLDFGTESVRGVLVDVDSGEEIATAVSEYEHGVIDGKYHDPDDYLHSMDSVLRELGSLGRYRRRCYGLQRPALQSGRDVAFPPIGRPSLSGQDLEEP